MDRKGESGVTVSTALRSAKSKSRIKTAKPRRQRPRPRPQVDLETKTLPSQARSKSTFDAILRVAGETLAEKGPGAFSVNAVCLRGDFSPPAFYRYFPNKYALLKALAQRLMDAGDDAVVMAMARDGLPQTEEQLLGELRRVLTALVTATASFPGSVQILRALRSTPEMRQVQLASTARVAGRRLERLRAMFPNADPARLRRGVWLGLETANIAVELIVEGAYKEAGKTVQATIDDAAVMLARYYWHLGDSQTARR